MLSPFENLTKSIIIHLAISEALSSKWGRNSYDLSGFALPSKAASVTLKCHLAVAAQLYCAKGSYTAQFSNYIVKFSSLKMIHSPADQP